jgi:hypothetical protein
MAGGTVTITGGNVIHTFTSSGYLTPIKYVNNSLRFRGSANAYLNRTWGTPTNNKIWTYSCWVKLGDQTNYRSQILSSGITGSPVDYAQFQFVGALNYQETISSASALNVSTVAVFRDFAAWYHVTLAVDTTQATATNRVKIYINGVLQALTITTQVAQNTDTTINKATRLGGIGALAYNGSYINNSDGYMADVNFIDGQALTPTSFGTTNSYGVWQPITYGGSYGTNGFYLPFTNKTSTTTLGYDFSPNGNNWTPNNISVTAGTTYDSMVDSPTVGATSSNYAVINPVFKSSSQPTISNGNLTVAPNVATYQNAFSTIGSTSGKQYCEITITGAPNSANMWGVANAAQLNSMTTAVEILGSSALSGTGYGYYYDGRKYSAGTLSSYGSAVSSGDVMGIALDLDNGKVWFSLNGTWQASGDPAAGTNAAFTGIVASGTWFFGATAHSGGSTAYNYNFGQRPFSYTPPTGFVALNTFNLPASTITNGAAYMAATLYTGTGASLTVANTVGSTSFQPDWVWAKSRSAATDHALYDSVRGVQKQLESNNTDAETTQTTGLTAFGSTGFTVGALAQMNTSAATYVAWQWKAGTTSSSNTNGTITSTVSVGVTQGFSVVTYTGTGANATVGHGLGVAPSFIIARRRNDVVNWYCYHASLSAGNIILLNSTNAQVSVPTAFNSGTPTSTTFPVGGDSTTNASGGLQLAYCFSAVAGYSAFGSYTGNGSTDGPFVYTGFRPRFIMIKQSSAAGEDWLMQDTSRFPNNVSTTNTTLYADSSSAEVNSSAQLWDVLSNGFKQRGTGGGNNASGSTYIYMAFSEVGFKYALGR